MTSFVIKLIAIISMLFDHTGDIAIGHLSICNLIGRIAFPLFSFQLVVGYTHTKNIKKYIERMLIFAVISQLLFSFFVHTFEGTYFELNIFFTLLASLMCMYILNSKTIKSYFKIFSICAILIISYYLRFDYDIWGIMYTLFIFAFYPFKDRLGKNCFEFTNFTNIEQSNEKNINSKNIKMTHKKDQYIDNKNTVNEKRININNDSNKDKTKEILIFVLGSLAFTIIKWMKFFKLISFSWSFSLVFFTFLPTIFMLLFNGKKGPSAKYLFYAFYPVHLAILDLIYYFI